MGFLVLLKLRIVLSNHPRFVDLKWVLSLQLVQHQSLFVLKLILSESFSNLTIMSTRRLPMMKVQEVERDSSFDTSKQPVKNPNRPAACQFGLENVQMQI